VKKKSPLRTVIITAIIVIAVIMLVKSFWIPEFNCIAPGILYTSGQPRGMDYTRLLYKYHIATIINLRSPAEHREQNWYNEEMAWVHNNGVKYFEVPLERNVNDPAHFPDSNMQQKFLELMTVKDNIPVLVHDGRGEGRVAIFAAVWLAKEQRLPLEQVLAKVAYVKGQPLTEQEKTFVRSLFK